MANLWIKSQLELLTIELLNRKQCSAYFFTKYDPKPVRLAWERSDVWGLIYGHLHYRERLLYAVVNSSYELKFDSLSTYSDLYEHIFNPPPDGLWMRCNLSYDWKENKFFLRNVYIISNDPWGLSMTKAAISSMCPFALDKSHFIVEGLLLSTCDELNSYTLEVRDYDSSSGVTLLPIRYPLVVSTDFLPSTKQPCTTRCICYLSLENHYLEWLMDF
jgi:hypothetical protein